MTDVWFTAVAFVLVVLAPFDWYVAVKFISAASQRPYIRVLTLAAVRSTAIAVAATIAAGIAFTSIYFNYTGIRLLPAPWTAVLLACAVTIISLPNFYALRVLDGDEE